MLSLVIGLAVKAAAAGLIIKDYQPQTVLLATGLILLATTTVLFPDQIAEEAAHLDRRDAEYLVGLDDSDAREPDEVRSATAAALDALRARRATAESAAFAQAI